MINIACIGKLQVSTQDHLTMGIYVEDLPRLGLLVFSSSMLVGSTHALFGTSVENDQMQPAK